ADHDSPLYQWLHRQGSEVRMTLTRPGTVQAPDLRWGELHIAQNTLAVGKANAQSIGGAWESVARGIAAGRMKIESLGEPSAAMLQLPMVLAREFGIAVSPCFKLVQEFRLRSVPGLRSSISESMSGTETASVLLTLKNHHDPQVRARYKQAVAAFKDLFPEYEIDAVEREPGKGDPDVQFREEGIEEPLSVQQVSAGVHEVLTLVTDLVAREGLIFFVEHPEAHLHPHSMRGMKSLLVRSAGRNQVIIVTHDPHFVDPDGVLGLRRFWRSPGSGTHVSQLKPSTRVEQISQMKTVLRRLSQREVVFSRAVLLVEDESLYEFLVPVAETLEHNIDARGVSIIYTGGQHGHKPFRALLHALDIPYVCLRDLTWGSNTDFPPSQFFSLDAEFEEYVDAHGLADLRHDLLDKVGKGSKARVAGALGRSVSRGQIPPVFDEVLRVAVGLAKGDTGSTAHG
ncbi:MAG: AAA family ATPase, partial [Chloroflexi bacterium]|nr:AAA family ATPase [Chloroflexota bacterium]